MNIAWVFGFLSAVGQNKEITLKWGFLPLVVKSMAKSYIIINFRPSTMDFSTRHLTLCNHIYLSGCRQFNQVGTGQNWFSHACQVDSFRKSVAYHITCALDFNKRGCVRRNLSGLKLSVSIANPCSKLLCTEVKGIVSSS